LVPFAGITTERLVAPGAMSPVSTLPSFNTTRCVTESPFLKTTVWPPKLAGFGEKACVPFEPMIVIVVAAAGEGELGVELLLPPQLPHRTTATDTKTKSWSRIRSPHSPPPSRARLQGAYRMS
jgi:hypothetical protein